MVGHSFSPKEILPFLLNNFPSLTLCKVYVLKSFWGVDQSFVKVQKEIEFVRRSLSERLTRDEPFLGALWRFSKKRTKTIGKIPTTPWWAIQVQKFVLAQNVCKMIYSRGHKKSYAIKHFFIFTVQRFSLLNLSHRTTTIWIQYWIVFYGMYFFSM